MYNPSSFKVADVAEIHACMRSYSFAVLVAHGSGGMVATHLPILLDADADAQGRLVGHMARANPQWRDIEGEALVVFSGPHVYVSPTWYESPGTVPTWNYVAVHAYGVLRLIEDRDALHAILKWTVETYESSMRPPWTYDEADPQFDAMLRETVGFEIEITRLEGKRKLNQNRPEEQRRRVARVLATRSDDDSREIAKLMEESLAKGV